MSLDFDPGKNASNLAQHDVSLAEGDGVLRDPLAITIEDAFVAGESRWVTLGVNFSGLLMVVVRTERGEDARLTSARRANPEGA